VNVDAVLAGIDDIAKAAVREAVYEAMLKAAAQAAGVAAETVFPIVKVVTISQELYSKVKKAKNRYNRENLEDSTDDMLDFSVQLQEENEAVNKTTELFNALFDTLDK